MLWRVRTTLSDRPGSLAALARTCGERAVNILGLQIFPGLGGVTDELVLRTPDGWGAADLERLVDASGGSRVVVDPCTEHALMDGPIQYLHALRRVAHDPSTLREMLCRLLDAGAVDTGADQGAEPAAAPDTLSLEVGDERLTVARTAPFTATEHARAVAFAEVAAELVGTQQPGPSYDVGSRPLPGSAEPVVRLAGHADAAAVVRMHLRCSGDTIHRRYQAPLARVDDRMARRLVGGAGSLAATVGQEVVGLATLGDVTTGDDTTGDRATVEVSLLVEDAWQRHGVGTRLLTAAARLARGRGADEVVLRSRTEHPALTALAFACGLRARIRLVGDEVVVTVGLDGLKPLVPA